MKTERDGKKRWKRVMVGPKAVAANEAENSDRSKRLILKALRPYPDGDRPWSRPQPQGRQSPRTYPFDNHWGQQGYHYHLLSSLGSPSC